MVTLCSISVPCSYSQAVQQECWKYAILEDLDALQANHTWDVVPCWLSVKPIRCKWIYSLELKTNDTLDRNKAHPVALGYCNKQEYGIDYDKTFAPAKMTTMSMILATAAAQS